jgi:PAS domain-containing protein
LETVTKNSKIEYEFIAENALFIKSSGVFDIESVHKSFEALNKQLEGKRKVHVISDYSELVSVPWQSRTFILNNVNDWFIESKVAHMHIINPNPWIKTIIYLASKFFEKITISLYNDLSSVLNALKEVSPIVNPITAKEIKRIINKKEDHFIFRKKASKTDENGNSVFVALIDPDIFISQYKGTLTAPLLNFVFDFAEDNFPRIDANYYSVLDTSEVNGITSEGRKIFGARSKNVKQYVKHRYYKFSRALKAIAKGYALINKDFGRETTLIDDFYVTIAQLLNKESRNKGIQTESIELNESDLAKLSKEELIQIIMTAYDDGINYKEKVIAGSKMLQKSLASINWKENFEIKPLDADATLPEFYNLFLDINRIQFEAAYLINELEYKNQDLNYLVEERTKEIEKKSSNLSSLLESYDSPIWLVDKDYKLIDLNRTFYDAIKVVYGKELSKGHVVFEHLGEDVKVFWKEKYDVALKGEVIEFNQEFFGQGKVSSFVFKVFPIRTDNEIIGCGVIANDITKLIESEQKLKNQNETLTKLNSELDTFIYRSSHDMRAPIATLLGLVEMVKNETDETKRQKCFDFMEESVAKLDGFIHEITELTKNSKYEIEKTNINFKLFLNEILGELAYLKN